MDGSSVKDYLHYLVLLHRSQNRAALFEMVREKIESATESEFDEAVKALQSEGAIMCFGESLCVPGAVGSDTMELPEETVSKAPRLWMALLGGGLGLSLYALMFMDTTVKVPEVAGIQPRVERVHNIGLMQDRWMYLMIGLVMAAFGGAMIARTRN